MIRLLAALVVLAGLVGVAAVATPRLVDPTTLQAWLETRLERTLGAEIATRGAIDLALLPQPRVVIDELVVHHPDFELAAARAVVELAWAPLLRLDLVPADLRVEDFTARTSADSTALLLATGALPPELAHLRFEAVRGIVGGEGRSPLAVERVTSRPGEVRRSLSLVGTYADRAARIDAVVLPERAEGGRVERLTVDFGGDRFEFTGRLDTDGARGTFVANLADIEATRAVLPTLPVPPLVDAVLAGIDGRIEVAGDVDVTDGETRFENLTLAVEERTLAGRLAWIDGRVDAALRLTDTMNPLPLAAAAIGALRTAPDLLADVAHLELDATTMRVRLTRTDGELATSVRLGLEGATDIAAEGRIDLETLRFEGPITLVSDDLSQAAPRLAELPWPTPWAVTLAAELSADADRLTFADVEFTAPALVFRGAAAWMPDARPAVALDGVVDRLRVPLPRADGDGRRRLLEALWEAADRGGAVVDLDVRRLELGDGDTGAGRIIAELDRQGLWVTAFELEGRDVALSVTGGIDRGREHIDALGAVELSAPARALHRHLPDAVPRLAGLPAGRLDVTLQGPLAAARLALDGSFGRLDIELDGDVDLWRQRLVEADLRLHHPDASALLARLGGTPMGTNRLSGAVSVDAALAATAWRGQAALAALTTRFGATPGQLELTGLRGPQADLQALLATLGLLPDDLGRWRERHQGDWPTTPPLARLWLQPFALRVADAVLEGPRGRTSLQLTLDVTAEAIMLDTLDWRAPSRVYRLSGGVVRGERGVRAEGRLVFEDDLDAPLATALGFGWLGGGRLAVDARFATLGAGIGDLVANLDGTLAVEGETAPRALRLRDGRSAVLPAWSLDTTLTIASGRLGFDEFARLGIAGVADLYANRLAATLLVPGGPDAPDHRLLAIGRLGEPRWRHAEAP